MTHFCNQSHWILGEKNNSAGQKCVLHGDISYRKPPVHREPELSFLTSLHLLLSWHSCHHLCAWISHIGLQAPWGMGLRLRCVLPLVRAWCIVGASQVVKARRNVVAVLPQPGDPAPRAFVGSHPPGTAHPDIISSQSGTPNNFIKAVVP